MSLSLHYRNLCKIKISFFLYWVGNFEHSYAPEVILKHLTRVLCRVCEWIPTLLFLAPSNGNPLQYSCLENPTDGRAWWATVHGVTKSRTRLSDFTFTFFQELAEHIQGMVLKRFFFFTLLKYTCGITVSRKTKHLAQN